MTFTFVFILNTESEFLMVSVCCNLAVDDGEWLDTRLMTVSRCEKRFSFEKKSRKVERQPCLLPYAGDIMFLLDYKPETIVGSLKRQ